MNLPWCKFYPRDWFGDMQLRALSYAARGLWVDMCCLMAMSEQHGFLVVNDRPLTRAEDLARLTSGGTAEVRRLLAELENAGVFSRDKRGVIYCRRMVRDGQAREQIRQRVARHRMESRRNAPRNAECNAECNGESPETRRIESVLPSHVLCSRTDPGAGPDGGEISSIKEGQDGRTDGEVEKCVKMLAAEFTAGNAPALDAVLAYAVARGYPEDKARRFFELNLEAGWRFPNGRSIRNWKSALHNFCHKSAP